MIRKTLQCRLDNNDRDGGDFKDVDYDTDDSCDVSRRSWARNKRDTVIVRRSTVVDRGKVLVSLPSVQWPLRNQARSHCLEHQRIARRRRARRNKRDTTIVRRSTVENRGKALVSLPSVQWPLGNQARRHRLEHQHIARRRWARNKKDTVTVRRSTLVNRGKVLVSLRSVQWPLGNQDCRHRLEHQHIARRRWARNKGDTSIVRRSTMVDREKVLVNLRSVQLPLEN
jgi:hypothetical protein